MVESHRHGEKIGTAAAWISSNPTLNLGERGVESDTGRSKVGDGSTVWTGLAYAHPQLVSGLVPESELPSHLATGTVATLAAVAATTRPAKVPALVGDWDYGGETGTDETTVVQNAIDAASDGDLVLIPPGLSGVRITDTITVPAQINLHCESPLVYDGPDGQTALIVGEAGVVNFRPDLLISVVRGTLADWTDEADIGVQLVNCNKASVRITQARQFTIGVQAIGDGSGFAYSHVFLGDLRDNKYGLDCRAGGASNGWVNENTWFSGRFGATSTTHTTLDRFGIRWSRAAGNPHKVNGNKFYGPSFEMGEATATGDTVGVMSEYGSNNLIDWARVENTALLARSDGSGSSQFNVLRLGFEALGLVSLTDWVDDPDLAFTLSGGRTTEFEGGALIYQSPALHKRWCYYDGGTSIHVPNLVFGGTAPATRREEHTGLTPNSRYLEVPGSRMIGVFIETTKVKELIARRDVEDDGGRWVVRAFDSSDVHLDSDGVGHPYVIGDLTYAEVQEAYREGADQDRAIRFRVTADVDYVFVGINGGTSSAKVRSFAVYSAEPTYGATWWTGFPSGLINRANTPPTAGSWLQGHLIDNAEPSAGSPSGWVCVTGGTPGTWKARAAIAT